MSFIFPKLWNKFLQDNQGIWQKRYQLIRFPKFTKTRTFHTWQASVFNIFKRQPFIYFSLSLCVFNIFPSYMPNFPNICSNMCLWVSLKSNFAQARANYFEVLVLYMSLAHRLIAKLTPKLNITQALTELPG